MAINVMKIILRGNKRVKDSPAIKATVMDLSENRFCVATLNSGSLRLLGRENGFSVSLQFIHSCVIVEPGRKMVSLDGSYYF